MDMKCRLGLHDWGDWQYVEDGACRQIRTCRRRDCGAQKEQLLHAWEDWQYQAEGACEQTRGCSRCAAVDRRTLHTWGEIYVAPNSCEVTQGCTRCDEKRTGMVATVKNVLAGVKHVWGEWRYTAEDQCTQLRVCERCGHQETRVQHIWSQWDYVAPDDCAQNRGCERCHQVEKRSEHVWGEWDFVAEDSCTQERRCQRCWRRETRTVSHTWTDWMYVGPRSCTQRRICLRCMAQESQIAHVWADGVPDQDMAYYEIVLHQLMSRAQQNKDAFDDIQSLEQQLRQNLQMNRRYGDTDTSRVERNRILDQLEKLAWTTLKRSLSDLNFIISSNRDPLGRYQVFEKKSGKPAKVCDRCGELHVLEVGS